MKKWIISSIIYLAIVIVGYYTFDALYLEDHTASEHGSEHNTNTDAKETEEITESHTSHETDPEDEHMHGDEANAENQVQITVKEDKNKIYLTLEDLSGNPVTDLEVNHEKLLHLIVVDNHLDQFFHLHPEETGPGQFEVDNKLEEGAYKAFVDIKPTNLEYEVQPIAFTVGNPTINEHVHGSLEVDENFEQTIDGNTVTMTTTPLVTNQAVTLTFDVHGAKLEPYLGAMGHVVILDEDAKQYLHVHPLEGEKPVFETQFSKPGTYKIWTEFQVDGKVTAYPFVIEVK